MSHGLATFRKVWCSEAQRKELALRAIVLECPICQKRVSLKAASRHRKHHHPEIDSTEYLSIIDETKKKGQLRFKQYRIPKAPKTPNSGTTVLQQASNTSKGVRSIVSAGAFGMGRKR